MPKLTEVQSDLIGGVVILAFAAYSVATGSIGLGLMKSANRADQPRLFWCLAAFVAAIGLTALILGIRGLS